MTAGVMIADESWHKSIERMARKAIQKMMNRTVTVFNPDGSLRARYQKVGGYRLRDDGGVDVMAIDPIAHFPRGMWGHVECKMCAPAEEKPADVNVSVSISTPPPPEYKPMLPIPEGQRNAVAVPLGAILFMGGRQWELIEKRRSRDSGEGEARLELLFMVGRSAAMDLRRLYSAAEFDEICERGFIILNDDGAGESE